jgi:hypothetical protein
MNQKRIRNKSRTGYVDALMNALNLQEFYGREGALNIAEIGRAIGKSPDRWAEVYPILKYQIYLN